MQTLSEYFAANGLGIRPVARAACIDHGALWKYLNGINVPKPESADAVGDVIGLSGRQVREMVKAEKAARKSARSGVA